MKARFMAEKPQEIEATMKITMSIKDWEKLRDELGNNYPAWKLTSNINKLLSSFRKVFYEEHNLDDE